MLPQIIPEVNYSHSWLNSSKRPVQTVTVSGCSRFTGSRGDSAPDWGVCQSFWNDLIMSVLSSHLTRPINRAGPHWPWKKSLSQVKITLQGKINFFNTSLISSVLLLWKMRASVNPPCKNDLWEEEVTKELNYPVESKLWFVGSTGNKRLRLAARAPRGHDLLLVFPWKLLCDSLALLAPLSSLPSPQHHH